MFVLDIILFIALVISVVMLVLSIRSVNRWKDKYGALVSQKKSSETRIGQVYEQMAPFLKGFKHNPKDSHFLGQPIDYVIFEDDKIVFLEVKYGYSRLSERQEKIKKLVEDGKVVWEELRNTDKNS